MNKMEIKNEYKYLIGRKIRGFKVSDDPKNRYNHFMDNVIGKIGEIFYVSGDYIHVIFDNDNRWNYPLPEALEFIVEETPENTQISAPNYYGDKDSPYEAIKVINAWGLDFSLGNVVKYIARAGKKENNTELSDLLKAKDYLENKINLIKNGTI